MLFRSRKINLSGITPTNPNQSGQNLADMHRSRDDNGQEILGAIGRRGGKMRGELGRVPRTFNGQVSPNLAVSLLSNCEHRRIE